jgi:hypothetical protein
MIAKRYFSALIILLLFFGFSEKQVSVPNQQIELQFTNQEVVQEDTQDIILSITQQLEALGITDIQVKQQEDGILKISYYSDAAVAEIKKVLFANGIHSDGTSKEIPDNTNIVKFKEYGTVDTFKLDVYELQTTSNPYAGIHGKYIIALQKDFDKSPNPNSFGHTSSFLTGELKTTIALVYTESGYTTIHKENISYEIPDVRAGPTSSLHS